MHNLCCQNVLAEKALESIIWQQYLLSRGKNKQLHHYSVTPTEPGDSREQHTINSDGSRLRQMMFVSDTEPGGFGPRHIKSSQLFILSLQPDIKIIFDA